MPGIPTINSSKNIIKCKSGMFNNLMCQKFWAPYLNDHYLMPLRICHPPTKSNWTSGSIKHEPRDECQPLVADCPRFVTPFICRKSLSLNLTFYSCDTVDASEIRSPAITTGDVFEADFNYLSLNWLAGFLNHQQYVIDVTSSNLSLNWWVDPGFLEPTSRNTHLCQMVRNCRLPCWRPLRVHSEVF